MTDTLKNLANVVLAASSSGTANDIYVPGAGVTAIISSFRLVANASGGPFTVDGAYRVAGGTTDVYIIPMDLSLSSGYCYSDSDPITLGTSDKLRFWASSASAVHCVVSGIEHTT
jgi:hypothetical protein